MNKRKPKFALTSSFQKVIWMPEFRGRKNSSSVVNRLFLFTITISAETNKHSNRQWKIDNSCSKIDFVPKYTISDTKIKLVLEHIVFNYELIVGLIPPKNVTNK